MKKRTRKRLVKWIIPLAFVAAFFFGTMAVYLIMIFQAHLNLVEDIRAVIKVQQTQLEAQRAAPRGPAPRLPAERPPAQ